MRKADERDVGATELLRLLDAAEAGLTAVRTLIRESAGVSKLQLRVGCLSWTDLRTGGRYEEWLRPFDEALLAFDARRTKMSLAETLLAITIAVTPTHAEILDAIRVVESSGKEDVPVGDNGEAIGPYQIHQGYWADAVAFDRKKGIYQIKGGKYSDCNQLDYATRTVTAYLTRYAPKEWEARDIEKLARIHNGGPNGVRFPETKGYAKKVIAAFAKAHPEKVRPVPASIVGKKKAPIMRKHTTGASPKKTPTKKRKK